MHDVYLPATPLSVGISNVRQAGVLDGLVSGWPVARNIGLPVARCSGVPVLRSSGRPDIRIAAPQGVIQSKLRLTGHPEHRNIGD